MLNLGVAFTISFCALLMIVRYAKQLAPASLDFDLSGVQKNHGTAVPRIGGAGIAIAMVATFAISALFDRETWHEALVLMACGAPAFLSGIIEDVTKRVSTRVRLLSAMASALACALVLQAAVGRIDVPMIDRALVVAPIAIAFTMLAVAGVTNAVNIIDGFNGLASVIAIFIFASIGYVAHRVDDPLVMTVALTAIGALGGFVLWNYPVGQIFLGDGGAYLIGFLIAELLVLLVARHPNLCAWYAAVVAIYPIFETLFSIYRRRLVRGRPADQPDGVHLHTLVYKRIVRKGGTVVGPRHRTRNNARTSPYLWVLSLVGIVPATFFWDNPVGLAASAGGFVLIYVWLYVAIVKFRTPHWLAGRRTAVQLGHRPSRRADPS
jgi:UDP-N-acetylmuramyl pentapeptide phosphotransferase/UDP-N-acetylglucosamine-1-phosphate transferase